MSILNSINSIRAGVLAVVAAGIAGTASFSASAEELSPDSIVSITAEINAAGHVRISQPEKLTARLVRKKKAAAPETVVDADGTRIETAASARRQASSVRAGYRVQVFDDNNPRTARQTASNLKNKIESTFPAYRAYVSFNSPYWRVKTGDFRSRAEAESAMAEIRRAFPELKAYIRIVRDRVNIYD